MATFITVDTPSGKKTIDEDRIVIVNHGALLDYIEFSTGQVLVIHKGQIGGDDAKGTG